MTTIHMEFNKTGASVTFESTTETFIRCPRCADEIESGVPHRCGDKVLGFRDAAMAVEVGSVQ